MLKLYEIKLAHAAPKDLVKVTIGYVLANNDEDVYCYIDKEHKSGIWTDRNDDSLRDDAYKVEIYNDDFEVVDKISYKDYMLKIKGEFYEESPDFSDAYYGVSLYGWNEIKEVSDDEIKVILDLGIAKKIV